MPCYTLQCLNGHEEDIYLPTWKERGVQTYICPLCRHSMGRTLSMGAGLLFFEEGRGRWIRNLGHEPVYVTTYAQHERLMKERGLAHATKDDLLHNKTRRALDTPTRKSYLDGLNI